MIAYCVGGLQSKCDFTVFERNNKALWGSLSGRQKLRLWLTREQFVLQSKPGEKAVHMGVTDASTGGCVEGMYIPYTMQISWNGFSIQLRGLQKQRCLLT